MKKLNSFVLSTCAGLVFLCGALDLAAEKPGEMKPTEVWDPVLNAMVEGPEECKESDKCECPDDASGNGGGTPADGDPAIRCVQMNVGLGRTRFSAITESVVLQLNEMTPTTALYSPAGFRVLAGRAVYRVSREKTAGGVPKWVQISSASGLLSSFLFADNESVGLPVSGQEGRMAERLAMVDAQGWATAADPAYYDYYPGNGSRWRFGAAPSGSDYLQFIEHQTPQGRVEHRQDIGLEIIRDAEGVLRQVLTPSRLAHFTVVGLDAYDLAVYPNDASCLSGARTQEGFLEILPGAVPEVVWKFRNPAPGTYGILDVTREKPGADPATWRYEYVDDVGDFILKSPGGVKEERVERTKSDDGKLSLLRRIKAGPDGVPYWEKEQTYATVAGGVRLTRSAQDPRGLNLVTEYAYHTSGAAAGLQSATFSPDGSWIRYEYDDLRRKTAEIRPWLDAPTNAPLTQCSVTRTGYGLFAPGDFLAYNDQRPRTEIKEICGIEVSRTYRAYPTNALGQAQEIEERAAFPGAPYGHAANPSTVKTYYASTAALPLPGRLATVVYPGGKTESYGYEYGTFNAATFAFTPDPDGGAWRETVTTSYGPNSGVQALRSARVWNEKGLEVLDESYVEDGAAFARIGWKRMSYDRNGKLIETTYSDGRVESATWGANCCGKESETAADGTTMAYGYNLLKQKVSETRKGMAADGSGDITTLYTYDLENRVLSTAVTNFSSGLGYVASRSAYDAVGRTTNAVDRLGNATETEYDTNGTVTVRMPNGVARVTEKYGDGRARFVGEDGVIRQAYVYGVTPEGQRWTLSAKGSLPSGGAVKTVAELRALASVLDCPWTLAFQDSFGQPAVSMRPGFGRTVLVTSNAYDAAGNLLSSAETSCRPDGTDVELVKSQLYAYAADGSRHYSALDLNTNGVIDVAGPDRIDGSAAAHEKAGADWWRVSRSWVYPEFNSAVAVTTSVQRVRLSGLGVQQGDDGVLVSYAETLDVRGNSTVSEVLVDRTARRVTQVTVSPTSVQPSIQTAVNGLPASVVSVTSVTNTYDYDALGRRTAVTDGRGNTSITAYNPVGQLLYAEDAATNRTTYGYDTLGRRTSVTDALGNVTHTQYDADGRVTKAWGATYPVEYGYDTLGRMVSMKTFREENGPGDETRWFYDQPTGLLTNKLYSDGFGPAYTYTPDGKLATRLWARGISTSYAYDMAGSLADVDYSDSTPDIAYTFDRLGRQLSAVSSVSTNFFTYSPDTLELLSETQNGLSLTRLIDTQGRPAGLSLGGDYSVTYGYDDLGRYASVSSSVCSVSSVVDYSRLSGTDLVAGYTAGPLTVTKTYEPKRDLITQVRNETSAGVISQYDYANDAIGRRVFRHDSGLAFANAKTNAFGYNHRSEVTSAVMHTNAYGYVYDSIGNRLVSSHNADTNTYVANALNQYTNILYASAPLRLTHDPDGNMIFDGKEWFYVWNGENRLILASNATHIVTYAYDYRGRMVWKTMSPANAPPAKTIAYIWDDYNIVVEQVAFENITNIIYNTWGCDLSGTLQGAGGVGGLLTVCTLPAAGSQPPTVYFTCYDANGNITEYVSSDSAIVTHREYSIFGEIINKTGALDNSLTFWWSTKPWCTITKLSEYQFREYSPVIGRWLRADQAGESYSLNLFSYVDNNAINDVDVLGLFAVRHPEITLYFCYETDAAEASVDLCCKNIEVNIKLKAEATSSCEGKGRKLLVKSFVKTMDQSGSSPCEWKASLSVTARMYIYDVDLGWSVPPEPTLPPIKINLDIDLGECCSAKK